MNFSKWSADKHLVHTVERDASLSPPSFLPVSQFLYHPTENFIPVVQPAGLWECPLVIHMQASAQGPAPGVQ